VADQGEADAAEGDGRRAEGQRGQSRDTDHVRPRRAAWTGSAAGRPGRDHAAAQQGDTEQDRADDVRGDNVR